MAQPPSRPEARSRLGVRRRSRFAESTTLLGPTATAGGTTCRLHGKPRADPFGRVKAVAARSAGARSASLDVAKSISDRPATTSQLLIQSPRRPPRAALAELRGRAPSRF